MLGIGSPGTVGGHVLPGVMILALGIHQAFGTCRLLLAHNNRPSRSWYPAPWPYGCAIRPDWPVEPVLKVLGAGLGFIVEIYAKALPSLDPRRTFWRPLHEGPDGRIVPGHIELWAHATMYLSFILVGMTELYGVLLLRCRTGGRDPANELARVAALAATSLGWGMSSASMLFHSFGQSAVWSRAHLILAGFAGGASVAAAVEAAAMPAGSARFAPILRTACVILQGTWYLKIASMLAHPDVWVNGETGVLTLPVEMNLQVLGVAFVLLSVYAALGLCIGATTGRCRTPAALELSDYEDGVRRSAECEELEGIAIS